MNTKEILAKELLNTIGKNLAEVREEKEISLKQVADALGIKVSDFEKIEAGTFGLTIETLVSIVNFYKVGLQQILGIGVAQIYHFTQTNSAGNNHKQYVVNDHTNGYELLVDQLQKEVTYLRGYFDKYMELTQGEK